MASLLGVAVFPVAEIIAVLGAAAGLVRSWVALRAETRGVDTRRGRTTAGLGPAFPRLVVVSLPDGGRRRPGCASGPA